MDVYVLDGNLEPVGLIQGFTSLIWAERYRAVGDCELYLPVSEDALTLLRIGRYLKRSDSSAVYVIKKLTIKTDANSGDYITATGQNVQCFLDQRIVLDTLTIQGTVSTALEQMVSNALGASAATARRLKKVNGNQMFFVLGSGLSGSDEAQISYGNIGKTVRDYCTRFGWGYRCRYNNGGIAFQLYAGADRSDSVIFSRDLDNLNTSQHVVDDTNLGNLALVAGEGEGSERKRVTIGTASGVYRHEVFVDARDISSNVTYSELITAYPNGTISEQGGTYVYSIDGVVYATLPSASPQSNDTVVLSNTIYEQYLVARGTDKISSYGEKTTFEGSIVPYVQFTYNEDYFLGDIVTIKTQYGVTVKARIIEVVEVWNENGYSLEPKFEYLDIAVEPQYLTTENRQIILTQDGRGLMSQENARSGSVDGVKITELPSVSGLDSSQYFPVASVAETSKIDYDSLVDSITDDIPDASNNNRGFVSSGSQTFAGTKQFNNGIYVISGLYVVNTIGNGISAPIFKFSDAPSANAEYGRIFLAYANYGGRFKFRQYSGSSSAITNRREDYILPEPDASRTSNAEYDILTSKTIGITQAFNDTGMGASVVRNYTIPNGARGFLLINGGSTSAQGLYIFNCTSAGAIVYKAIVSASLITITTAKNKITLTKSSNNTNTFPTFIMTNGTVIKDAT